VGQNLPRPQRQRLVPHDISHTKGCRPAGCLHRAGLTNLEVFLNGELIGSGGRLDGYITRSCYHPQLFSLPRALLKDRGNELRIRVVGFPASEVSARQRAAGLSAVEVDRVSVLQPHYDRQLVWNVTVAQIIAVTIGMLGASMLALAAMRRRNTYLL
jgi:two-component system sensor histidine kinase UhpB